MKLVGVAASVGLISLALLACSSPSGGGPTDPPPSNPPTSSPQNEGSTSSPIVLTVEVPRVCKVGTFNDGAIDSYYKVTGISAGSFYVKLSAFSPSSVSDMAVTIHTAADFSDIGIASSPATTNIQGTSTAMSQTFYLDVSNLYHDSDNVTFTMVVTTTP